MFAKSVLCSSSIDHDCIQVESTHRAIKTLVIFPRSDAPIKTAIEVRGTPVPPCGMFALKRLYSLIVASDHAMG